MIIYASRTNNNEHIISQVNLPSTNINEVTKVNSKYILLTYTDGLGMIPPIVDDFLRNHHSLCVGVIASGNRNFGHDYFCGSADKINQKYGIPILRKIDLRGYPSDYEAIIEVYNNLFGGEENE